jgi:hypothetical protein
MKHLHFEQRSTWLGFTLLLGVLLFSNVQVIGQTKQSISQIPGTQLIPVAPSSAQLPKIKGAENAVDWELLAKVTTKPVGKRIVAHYPASIMRLNKSEATLVGYMMPLSAGQKQTKFLFSYTASTCSFCLPAGPEGVVEVESKSGIKMSYEPMAIKGTFKVLVDDPGGMYYKLENASLIQ